MGMIPMNDTRYDLYQMLQQHVVELHEVPRPPNRTPATTLYFWSTSHKLIKDAAENFTFKSILNLKLRRQKFVSGDNMAIVEMADKYNESYRQLRSMDVTDIEIDQVVILVVTEDGTVQEFVKEKHDYLNALTESVEEWRKQNETPNNNTGGVSVNGLSNN